MGKNPEILKKCNYLGNVILSLASSHKHGDKERVRTYSFYTHKETNELYVKLSIRYYPVWKNSIVQCKDTTREIIDIDDFIEFWFKQDWYSSVDRTVRLDKLVKKVPKLKPYLAIYYL